MRQTSIEIYNQIKSNGLLSSRRLQIYKAIIDHPNSTASEILNKLGLKSNQSGRFTELAESGVILAAFQRKCRITGNNANVWSSTRELPKEVEKTKLTKKERLDHLEETVNLVVSLGKQLEGTQRSDLLRIYNRLKVIESM